MSAKKSIFLSTGSVEFIQLTTQKNGPKWSEAINSTIRQIRYLIKYSIPELTVEEWETLIDVYKTEEFPAYGLRPWIARDIMSRYGILSTELLDPKQATLVKKMDGLDDAEQLAVLYVIQIYKNSDSKAITEDIVQKIKNFM